MDFREISDRLDDIELLRTFYHETYVSQFPIVDERESLENMTEYLRRKAGGWYGRNNYHILLGIHGGRPQAGSITDYLAEPNAGVIEFLAIANSLRQHGLGRRLLDTTERVLAGDATANGRALDCIVAEMNDPFSPGALEDGLDPFVRAMIWDKWGYRRLDFPYVQPALSGEQAPVHGLLLLAKTYRPDYASGIPAATMTSILREYMRWAMRIDEPEHLEAYQRMRGAIDRSSVVPMVRLPHYIGRDDERPLAICEINSGNDPDLDRVLAVYAQSFPGRATDISPELFRDAVMAGHTDGTRRYHLWAVRSDPAQRVEGMASFFTFPEAGFGGYVTLIGSLRGTRRFPLLLARCEEQMVRDNLGAGGWYIECDPRREAQFAGLGFHAVDCDYRQPPLPGAVQTPESSPALRLMYKDFGRHYEPPLVARTRFLAAVRRILSIVYGITNVEEHPTYQALWHSAGRWPGEFIRFRQ
jgi:hypothetical protein